MLKIKEAIVVEGNYDKIKLSQLVDTTIIVTDGFMIFKNKSMLNMIGALADKQGVIVFTDSDRAGFQIRNHIKNSLSGKNIKHAYIPDIKGKEKRKEKPSKEGFLGVEGISDQIILDALKDSITLIDEKNERKITKSDLYDAGLYGGAQSAAARASLCRSLEIPAGISTGALIDALNALITKEEFLCMTTSPPSFTESIGTE